MYSWHLVYQSLCILESQLIPNLISARCKLCRVEVPFDKLLDKYLSFTFF